MVIPGDHNLTIYEACLIYGPTYPQTMQAWPFAPDNFNWFYTLFTPLADFSVAYKSQRLTSLEWGETERMAQLMPTAQQTKPGSMLPRSPEAMSDRQIKLVENANARGAKKHLLFSHFTAVCYSSEKPYKEGDERGVNELSDKETFGTFEKNRLALFQWVKNEKITVGPRMLSMRPKKSSHANLWTNSTRTVQKRSSWLRLCRLRPGWWEAQLL